MKNTITTAMNARSATGFILWIGPADFGSPAWPAFPFDCSKQRFHPANVRETSRVAVIKNESEDVKNLLRRKSGLRAKAGPQIPGRPFHSRSVWFATSDK